MFSRHDARPISGRTGVRGQRGRVAERAFARAARWRSAADDGRRGCRRAAGDAAAAVQAGNSGMNVRHNESMARHTSWRVGGPADCYFEPDTRESLSAFVRELSRSEEHTSELQSLIRNSYA